MLERLLESSADKKLLRTAGLRDALNLLQDCGDADKFEDLWEKVTEDDRQQLIKSRIGAPHEKASQFTPQCLKALKPPNTVLCYQVSVCTFEGYYPIPEEQRGKGSKAKKHWSIARTHGTKWTTLSALSQVVAFLWRMHAKCGRVATSVMLCNGTCPCFHKVNWSCCQGHCWEAQQSQGV